MPVALAVYLIVLILGTASTASYVLNAVSSSYATSASYAFNASTADSATSLRVTPT